MRTGPRGLVLVIDPDAATRTALTGFLRDCGYTTAEAATGTRALQLVREGVHAAATVCESPQFVEGLPRPVLLLTGSPLEGHGAADEAIAKPFQLVDFGDRVLRMLLDHPRA